MALYSIKSMNVHGWRKNLVLRNAQGVESVLPIHRFAMVGPGDQIELIGSPADLQMSLVTEADSTSRITITPHFQSHHEIKFGEDRLNLLLSEVHSKDDYDSYCRLEQFHYKGINLNQDPYSSNGGVKQAGGRRALLLASIQKNGMSRAIGYIEIQMPLMMCKPRHALFSRPFNHEASGVSWQTWLGDGQKYVNLIARIARVVVDPEFRGIGISTLLVEGAKTFCRERWHIGGARPLFIEISAEMLRYMDFVSRAGLHFVGNTEGNLQRIAKDLHSIEKGAGGKSGIMSLQRKYHSAFTAYCKKTGRTFDEARIVLSELVESSDPRSEMASDEWLAFRPILRFPIPYHIAGLNAEADKYIVEGLRPQAGAATPEQTGGTPSSSTVGKQRCSLTDLNNVVEFQGVEVWVDYTIPLSPYVRLVMDSFGIDTHHIRTKLLGPVDVVMSHGNIMLVTGASGAGKSVLLQALSGQYMSSGLMKTSKVEHLAGDVRTLTPLPDGIPIFQYFADTYGPDKAFSALCQVGLSEAMIFIKPFEVLSMGQRYRAMFADLILSDAQTWLIDEYCSNLDPITAKIISIRLRRLALRNKRFVIVAAANTEHFIEALSPDRIFVVRMGGEVVEMRLKEYMNGFYNKGF